jgi:hypothetical protein
MSCCPSQVTTFSNALSTTIAYSPAMQSQYGAAPKVTVLYWDGTQYVAAGIFTSIAFTGFPVTQITVDHGGPATGMVRIG